MNAALLTLLLSLTLNGSETSIFESDFIGMQKEDVTIAIKEDHKAFKLNTGFVNKSYNYLKFEDSIREITMLFFLNDKDECRMIRIMSDYSNITDLKEELNKYFTVEGNNWNRKVGNKKYVATLEEGDWFFTISITKEK